MGQVILSRIRNAFASSKPQEILMVGLDSVGKTTILYLLQDNNEVSTVPTIGFNIEEVKIANTKLKVLDMGGQEKIRHLWTSYSDTSNGIVYVFDISYPEKWEEAASHLFKVLEERNLPVLILLNKIDLLDGPDGPKEIEERKNAIMSICKPGLANRIYKVFTISAKIDPSNPDKAYSVIEEAFVWLNQTMKGRH